MPKITIITPVFTDTVDKTDWILETIESVQSQSFADWEMILVNDKSPIEPSEARYRWADDERIRWFDLAENSGPAKARNMAVALAESDCILPLDADDMLPEPTTLESMYDTWTMDKTKIIYGNIQNYVLKGNAFQLNSEAFILPDYNFHNYELMLWGIMPVTAMHSIDCHYAAGGWKSIFASGLEDVEYWIAAGLAGYCGVKSDITTLIYRRSNSNRSAKLKEDKNTIPIVQNKIRDLHSESLRRGIFPMACCGGNKNQSQGTNSVSMMSEQSQVQQGKIVPLEGDFQESELEWVAYNGPRKGSFGVLAGGSSYTIFGTGQVFQIHKSHKHIFERLQRQGFAMNQQDPRNRVELEPEPVIQEQERPQQFSVPKPELPVVERLDHIAARTRQIEIVERPQVPVELAPPSLANLETSDKITTTLDSDNWTIERISKATPQQLSTLSGIGIKRASKLIKKAQELQI